MPLLGAHQSIAGGYYKAVEIAAELKMDCVQIFTKNNNQWRAKPLTKEDVTLFRSALERTGIRQPCAHDSYLINLASPDDTLWERSLESFIMELQRADALGLGGLVIHPGSYVTSSEQQGLERIVKALDLATKATKDLKVEVWLENTAGQGSNLGHRLEHLQFLLEHVRDEHRFGICVDTCHLFAAGYPLQTPAQYAGTMQEFDKLIGVSRIRAFHLNDSLKDFGSRVDRHAHIGEGKLGLDAFRHVLNDPRFADIPMYLETAKGDRDGQSLDAMNLATLRGLVKKRTAAKQKPSATGKKRAKSAKKSKR